MYYINHWIPACAGMTARREKVGCYPDNPSVIPDKCLTSALRHFGEGRNPGNGAKTPNGTRLVPVCNKSIKVITLRCHSRLRRACIT